MQTKPNVLFPTKVWTTAPDDALDKDTLLKECYNHQKKNDSKQYSNVGGYQGHMFTSEMFTKFIVDNIPKSENHSGKFKQIGIESWVNINGKGCYNFRHNHFMQTKPILFCGVYYVDVPDYSGEIGFYDPRPLACRTMDEIYLSGYEPPVTYVMPEEGECYYFPSWLEHEVRENNTHEKRVSIAFNVCVEL